MTRIYLIGGAVVALILGIWYHVQVVEAKAREIAQLEISVKSAGETIAMMEKDRKDKEAANTDLLKQKEALAYENRRLESDLAQFPRTEVQRDCDNQLTPAGYPERMLDYARTQGPVPDPRPDVGTADRDISGDSGSGDLRSGEE